MEGQFQTSFIPKRPLVQKTPGLEPRPANIFLRGTIVIFILVLLLAGAAFGYTSYLTSTNSSLSTSVNSAVQALHPEQITQIQRLDTRIKSTQALLNQHIALSQFFALLSRATLSSVRFSSFHYTNTPGKLTVSMDGEAQSFSAVSWQASVLAGAPYSQYLSNPQFSNLGLGQGGIVTFTFTVDLNPTAFLYVTKFATATSTGTPVVITPITQDASVSTTTVATTTATTSKKTSTLKTH